MEQIISHLTHLSLMQVPEYIAQGAITVLLLLTGKWVAGLLSLVLTAYHVRAYMKQEHVIDVTEVFRQIPRQKVIRIVKLIIYLVSFVYFIFRYSPPHEKVSI